MKIILKAWLSDRVSTVCAVAYVVMQMIGIFVATQVPIILASALENPEQFQEYLIKVAIILVVKSVLDVFGPYTIKCGRSHLYNELDQRCVEKIAHADYDLFTSLSVASVNRAVNYISTICSVGKECLDIAVSIANIGITLYAMSTVAGTLIIPVMIIYMICAAVFVPLFKKTSKMDEDSEKLCEKRNREIEVMINGFMDVRAFRTQKYHIGREKEFNSDVANITGKRRNIHTGMNFFLSLTDAGAIIAVIVYAIPMIVAGDISAAAAMSLVALVGRIMDPLYTAVAILDFISDAKGRIAPWRDVMGYKNVNFDGNIELDDFGEISINDVQFSYKGSSADVLHGVSMKIKKGQHVGICGKSGGGKSTLFKLLNKFYQPTGGSITIDGINIWDITNDSYRRKVGCVFQENNVFDASIWDNVCYGTVSPLEAEVIEACKRAHIYDDIMKMPEKFQTNIGTKGLKLSGGQRQRLALARLFLMNPDVILLDEATSALDNESEAFIEQAIDELKGKTVIMIAHRLSTIRNCDKIYVLDSTGVAEEGTHQELMEKGGIYAKSVLP